MLIGLWIVWWLQSFPFTISFTHLLTLRLWLPYLDFGLTLALSISWLWIYLCDLHVLALDMTMIDDFSICMMLVIAALCRLYPLCSLCTFHVMMYVACAPIESFYASCCAWHFTWVLIMIDSLPAICTCTRQLWEQSLQLALRLAFCFDPLPWHCGHGVREPIVCRVMAAHAI